MNSKQTAQISHNQWLNKASALLSKAGIPSPRLDSELLLSFVIKQDRTWLIAHDNEFLDYKYCVAADALLAGRLRRIPIAYLIGHKDFYGRSFSMTSDVLIPRPETEILIDIAKTLPPLFAIHEVGTGSGCIAVTLKLEIPTAQISASDISPMAVAVAEENAAKHSAAVAFRISSLLTDTTDAYDLIVANLPYVDKNWECSPETKHEPSLALFADNNGLALIYNLIDQVPDRLTKHGYLLLEADPEQHESISTYAAQHNLDLIESREYAVLLQRR